VIRTNIFGIISKFVYPSIKRRLVEILYRELKLNQKYIAELLHISQSTVSRYLTMERGSYLDISTCEEIDNDLKILAKEISKEKYDEYSVEYNIVKITLKALGSGCICRFHKQIDPHIDPKKCKICLRLFKTFAVS